MFGRNDGVTPFGAAPSRKRDPSEPHPDARAELDAFDLLPPAGRAGLRESPNDVALAGKLAAIRRCGAPRSVLERLRARKLLPYQVGEGGILAELVIAELEQAQADETGSR